jgi:integrase
MRRAYENLAADGIEVTMRFVRDPIGGGPVKSHFMWDKQVPGLRLRIGTRKATWQYYREFSKRGVRSYVPRTLGYWPDMNVAAARKAAMLIAPKARSYTPEDDRLTFAEALEEYITYLKKEGSTSWAYNVASMGKVHLLPRWGHFTLAEMSRDPKAVREWYEKIPKKPTAKKLIKVIRAAYRNATRERRGLPPELPTSAVKLRQEEAPQFSMTEAQHREWAAAWQKIENPGHKAYWLTMILTGARSSELARLRSEDVAADHFTIRKSKKGHDIVVPISPQIRAALAMAPRGDGFVFPARRIKPGDLPFAGHNLRRNYKTIAMSLDPPIPEVLTELLLGHATRGVARRYMEVAMVSQSAATMSAQRRISSKIAELLGL